MFSIRPASARPQIPAVDDFADGSLRDDCRCALDDFQLMVRAFDRLDSCGSDLRLDEPTRL
jgi:hypothetical protein